MTYEEYLCAPGIDEHTEWVDGEVIPMMSVSRAHAELKMFVVEMLLAYLREHPVGRLYDEPFQMKLPGTRPGRSPDVMFVALESQERVRDLFLDGPADLVIEIISPGTESVDRGDKFLEYEAAGVPEYWILDPHREHAEFFVRDEKGAFRGGAVTPDGRYRSTSIPGLAVNVDWFWTRPPLRQIASQLEQHR
jgi:Uma2 family endonuclease